MLFYTARGQTRDPKGLLAAAGSACDLLEHVAGLPGYLNRQMIGLAKFWRARINLLQKGSTDYACADMEAALQFLNEPVSLRDRHDVLLELVSLYSKSKPERAIECVAEAQHIEERLGIPESQRTREI